MSRRSARDRRRIVVEARTGVPVVGVICYQTIMTSSLDPATATELEAAAFRRLVAHFQTRTDVQNKDVMDLAGFCRNCLAKWYRAAAVERGLELSDDAARERIYGMPYSEWKATHQR
jgi:uncharacterized protein